MYVCTSCSLGQAGFLDEARAALPEVEVVGVDCMSGCLHDQTVAFRGAGKVAYLFGDITAADFPDLKNFARLYAASEDGTFVNARVLGDLRGKALARIPG
jgi:predicted metal-binding protein